MRSPLVVHSLVLSLLPFLGAAAGAQDVLNEYVIYPGPDGRFYDRGNLGTSEGEVLQGYHKSTLAGLGDDGTAARIERVVTPIADFRNNTQETYDVVVRGGTDAAGPDLSVAPLGEVIGLNTPLLTNGNRTAWYLTARFAAPIAIPRNDFFTVGLRLRSSVYASDDYLRDFLHTCEGRTRAAGSDHSVSAPWAPE